MSTWMMAQLSLLPWPELRLLCARWVQAASLAPVWLGALHAIANLALSWLFFGCGAWRARMASSPSQRRWAIFLRVAGGIALLQALAALFWAAGFGVALAHKRYGHPISQGLAWGYGALLCFTLALTLWRLMSPVSSRELRARGVWASVVGLFLLSDAWAPGAAVWLVAQLKAQGAHLALLLGL